MSKELIKILSIDGGGIRGIIPALVMAEIEKRAQKPISKLFDLIAGTSTGGILALALTKPDPQRNPQYSAEFIARLYEIEGKRVFSRSVFQLISSLGNLIGPKYSSDGLEKVLDQYLGESKLSKALTNVLVTSYDIERREPIFFKSAKACQDEKCDFLIKDVAHATAVAPSYFPPFKLKIPYSSEYYALVDGGVFANNPAMSAFVEALKIYPDSNYLVVSLGTGELTDKLPIEEAQNWGVAQWAIPILNVVFDGVSDTTDYYLKKLLPNMDDFQYYYRFQGVLTRCSDALDDVRESNIRALKDLAYEIIEKNSAQLDRLCELLIR